MWFDILIYSLKTSLLFTVFYGGYWLLFRKNNRFNIKRIVLMMILIIAVVGPAIKIESSSNRPVSPYRFEAVEHLIQTPAPKSTDFAIEPGVIDVEGQEATKVNLEWKTIVPIIYLVGAIVSALFFLFQLGTILYILLTRKYDHSQPGLIFHKRVQHPFSFGKWIFSPLDSDYDASTWETILKHEKAHLDQKHSWDLFASSLFRIFLWYNPISYAFARTIKNNHECLADSVTLKFVSFSAYTKQLLAVALESTNFSIVHSFALKSNLIQRIKVMKTKKTSPIKTTISLVFMASIIFLFFTQMSLVAQQEKSKSKEEVQKMVEMLKKVKERPTFMQFTGQGFLPIQGLSKHDRILTKLEQEFPDKRIRIFFFELDRIQERRQYPLGPTGAGKVLFSAKLSDEDMQAIYDKSLEWVEQHVIPLYPDYEAPDKSIYQRYRYIAMKTIPSYGEAVNQYEEIYKFGTKTFKPHQVDELPKPEGGLENFLRSVALNAEMDPTLSMDELPKKIEFRFEIGLTGELGSLELISKVKGPEATQDKVYKLLRQLHDALIRLPLFRWEPGLKDGSPVVTEMTVEIPKRYLN